MLVSAMGKYRYKNQGADVGYLRQVFRISFHNYIVIINIAMPSTFFCTNKSVSFLYSKGGQITFVGSLRNAFDKTAVIIVEELHFQNRFAVKVDVDSGQLF